MAITCEWNCVLGSAKVDGETVMMYTGGNCTACICTKNKYLADFICDIDHLKRVLGKDGGHWKTGYSEIRLNGAWADAWKIAKELNKFGIEVVMYREEKKKMKDYKTTKIWVNVISEVSENIDSNIEYIKRELEQRKLDVANEEPDNTTDWKFEYIEDLQEKVKAHEWALNQINAPFKIKK